MSSEPSTQRGTPHWGPLGIPEGMRYAIWNRFTGACEQVDGPRRLWSMGSRVEALRLHIANPEEYLTISMRDGSIEHRRGPTSVWEDPIRHTNVKIRKALEVGSNEAIVLYRESMKDGVRQTTRTIRKGPIMYSPDGLEWLHAFSWHGTDQSSLQNDTQLKLPDQLCFRKLRLTPDQMYIDVPNVRTRDDALITVKVMIFLQLDDIEKMLDATHDPISEFMNSLSADVIDFAGTRSFEECKAELDALNDLSTYPKLTSRINLLGFIVSKVVCRGYQTSRQLQSMHDDAIHKRTELLLQKETQEQEQDLKDFKLDRDSQRAERLADFKLRRSLERQAIEKQTVEHQQAIEDCQAKAKLQRDKDAHQQQLQLDCDRNAQVLSKQREEHALAENHYTNLQKLGVDLSRYMIALGRGPGHRVIEVDTNGDTRAVPQLHVHSED